MSTTPSVDRSAEASTETCAKPEVRGFFDARTWTWTYVVYDPATKDAVIIDPVLDFDPANGRTWTESADLVVQFVEAQGLRVHLQLETHAHADHLSGSQHLKAKLGAGVAIGADITAVQKVFAPVFNLGPDFALDGSQFDHLIHDGEELQLGSLRIQGIATPGHTPACMSLLIGDALFSGDALFLPDVGVGRCDFPAGSAQTLYASVHGKLYNLPATTRVFVGHDYPPTGRVALAETTVAESKAHNVHLRESSTQDEFVAFRTGRDKGLAAPRLLLPSIQVNIDAGRLPKPEANGKSYLKIPLR
ncbi:MAG: MBL fold metallo-hydrolase [Deltaproteobacteria bacterium]|jgi:glyoxylase-like metal-dependent hydrolase (beta-lactamase superfamily II)|nr:MBL fold metallo-hydrolase [Deltaproteobacteria bacterium]